MRSGWSSENGTDVLATRLMADFFCDFMIMHNWGLEAGLDPGAAQHGCTAAGMHSDRES